MFAKIHHFVKSNINLFNFLGLHWFRKCIDLRHYCILICRVIFMKQATMNLSFNNLSGIIKKKKKRKECEWKWTYPRQSNKSHFRFKATIYLSNYYETASCKQNLIQIQQVYNGVKNCNLAKISINQSMTKFLALLWCVAAILLNETN